VIFEEKKNEDYQAEGPTTNSVFYQQLMSAFDKRGEERQRERERERATHV